MDRLIEWLKSSINTKQSIEHNTPGNVQSSSTSIITIEHLFFSLFSVYFWTIQLETIAHRTVSNNNSIMRCR